MTRMTRAVARVLAVALLISSCGGTNDSGPEASPEPASPTVSGAADPGETLPAPVAPELGAAEPDTSSSPPTTPVSAGGASPPPDTTPAPSSDVPPQPAAPAAPGTYRYDTEGTTRISDGPPRDLPAVTTLQVHEARGRAQRTIRDLRDRDGVGSVTEQILDYGPDGVRLTYLKLQTSVAGVDNTYEFRPADPPLVVRTGAAAGDQTTFTLEGNGTTIVTTATIKGTEAVTIDGTTVSTIVLELASQLSGSLTGAQTAISWIDTERSLPVQEDVDADVTSGAVRIRSSYTARLQKLTPG